MDTLRRRGLIALGVAVLCFVSFAFGRYSKQGTVTKGEDVVHEVVRYIAAEKSATVAEDTAKIVTHDQSVEETHAPDGTVKIVRKDVTTTGADHSTVKATAEAHVDSVETVRWLHRYSRREAPPEPQWMGELMIGLTTSSSRLRMPADLAPPAVTLAARIVPAAVGLRVSRRIAGPAWLSITLTSEKSVFVGAALQF